jgi:uncharacterized protein (DUF433 family)
LAPKRFVHSSSSATSIGSEARIAAPCSNVFSGNVDIPQAYQPRNRTIAARRVVRISGTRVTLDTAIGAFAEGASAEDIAGQHPSVPLGDIYEAIGYALRHAGEVERCLAGRRAVAQAVRAGAERGFPPEGIRARLLARAESDGRPRLTPYNE